MEKKQGNRFDDDWRRKHQDCELFQKLKRLKTLLTVVCALFSVGYYIWQNWFWMSGCLLIMAGCLVLDAKYPAYYTVDPGTKSTRLKNAIDLTIPFTMPLIPMIFMLRFHWIDIGKLILWIVVFSALITCLLHRLVPELRMTRPWEGIVVFMCCALMQTLVLGQANMVYDFKEPESYNAQVVELDYSSKHTNTCTVVLENGEEKSVDMELREFSRLEIGDEVLYQIYPGFFGVRYEMIEKP